MGYRWTSIIQIRMGQLCKRMWCHYLSSRCKQCNYILLISIPNLQPDSLGISKKELHQLLEDQELNGIPMLVIGNKVDIKPHLNEKEIIEGLNLDYIYSNEWLVVLTSALKSININSVVDWLLKRSAKHWSSIYICI